MKMEYSIVVYCDHCGTGDAPESHDKCYDHKVTFDPVKMLPPYGWLDVTPRVVGGGSARIVVCSAECLAKLEVIKSATQSAIGES